MYIPFDEISFDARIWVYQSNRELTDSESKTVTETLKAVLDGWEAHGKPLMASGKLFFHRFIVLAVDEKYEQPSGCSIDKSVHWLQEIGHQIGADFFDRSVAYLDDSGKVQTLPIGQVKQAIADEQIQPYTTVFNHLVATKAQWMNQWKIPADNSWLSRYFRQQAI
jgi:hypothetical protein